MKFAFLKELCKLDPMLNFIEARRLVIWVPPEAGRLMPAA